MPSYSQRSKRRILIVVAIVIGIAVIAAIAIPLALRGGDNDDEDDKKDDKSRNKSEAVTGSQPNDCFPEAEGNPSQANETVCQSRGCRFDANATKSPVCSYQDESYRLKVTDISTNDHGFTVKLEQVGSAPFGGDVANWIFRFENKGENVARFTFDTEDGNRYKVPKTMNLQSHSASSPNYDVKITNNESFAFQITRKDTGTVIWDSASVILSNQFLQAATLLPSTYVYGLGEQKHETLRHKLTKTWPAFSRDQPPSFDVRHYILPTNF
ncbi:maltase-glucoamylase, intestinal [Elysia marginata]|uniref:Maltase-glucoamylase, intestinal n=1 Tax=Elysia marginata TaxID=1093978 RepID=A0AAV4JGB7_9GAST|nr:maltase-glucoamylase, intestinal [Elysia marginata]